MISKNGEWFPRNLKVMQRVSDVSAFRADWG